MPDITLVRTSYLQTGTTGRIFNNMDIPICLSLERPWLDNQRDVSCIPVGLYDMVVDIRKPGTEKACEVWELVDVPGRDQIQLHIANKVDELLGCIATVSTLTVFKDHALFGGRSGSAFGEFMRTLSGKRKAQILITNGQFMPLPTKVMGEL